MTTRELNPIAIDTPKDFDFFTDDIASSDVIRLLLLNTDVIPLRDDIRPVRLFTDDIASSDVIRCIRLLTNIKSLGFIGNHICQ